MQELWQEVSSHSSVYSKLFSFGVRSLRSRESEASDLLLGDHLCGKSQTVKWIDVSRPQETPPSLQARGNEDIFEDNLVDTFYPQRQGCLPLRLCRTLSLESTKTATQCTANSASRSSPTTMRKSERTTFIPSWSSLCPSVTRETSSRRGRLQRVP